MSLGEIYAPCQYSRLGNRDHTGKLCSVADTEQFSYGTAGYRANASLLPFIVFRVGCIAGIRSRHLNRAIGVMITASHNPACDNGVKIIDPTGAMLEPSWEKIADDLINSSDKDFPPLTRRIRQKYPSTGFENACVYTACDTRLSSKYLLDAVACGVETTKTEVLCLGLLTTPQLHYIIRCKNDETFGNASEEGYYEKIRSAMIGLCYITYSGDRYVPDITLDCANGVGGQKFPLVPLDRIFFTVRLVNYGDAEFLNAKCGADYVKIEKAFPRNFETVPVGERCAAFDGDADRLIYFYKNGNGDLELVDGDKIAALFAKYLIQQVKDAELTEVFSVCVIQTGYANGNSTKFLRDELGVKVVVVATGIKNLQKEAEKFDIAVYFEANGHGTVFFSLRFYDVIKAIILQTEEKQKPAVTRLLCFSKLVNTTVGDAMCDLLAVEVLLKHFDWTIEDWQRMYIDLPNIQLKMKVPNRSIFVVSADEMTCIKPVKVQDMIDAAVKRYSCGRSFIRPSGTEDVLRIYAEAATVKEAEALAHDVTQIVHDVLGL